MCVSHGWLVYWIIIFLLSPFYFPLQTPATSHDKSNGPRFLKNLNGGRVQDSIRRLDSIVFLNFFLMKKQMKIETPASRDYLVFWCV